MPELPEVETIRNELTPHILGRKVTAVTLLWKGMVRQPSVEEFCSRIVGQSVTGIARHGKYLLLSLGSGDIWVIHLRMTGSLLLKRDAPDNRFTRAIIRFDNGQEIYFRDPRKFGVMWLVKDKNDILRKLGPEPLEAGFTAAVLARRLHNRTAPIKAILLDQKFVAGIGNMYADEALFAAGIHPLRPGGGLSRPEVERLHSAIKQVLNTAIGNKGASVQNYFRPSGEKGTAHYQFKVAHQGGKPCPNCGTPLLRLPVRNRGSYFCPKCQPAH